jgi:hypothetical protein
MAWLDLFVLTTGIISTEYQHQLLFFYNLSKYLHCGPSSETKCYRSRTTEILIQRCYRLAFMRFWDLSWSTSACYYQTTQHINPEESHLHNRRCDNLKFHPTTQHYLITICGVEKPQLNKWSSNRSWNKKKIENTFQNRMSWRIFGSKGQEVCGDCRTYDNDEFYNLYVSYGLNWKAGRYSADQEIYCLYDVWICFSVLTKGSHLAILADFNPIHTLTLRFVFILSSHLHIVLASMEWAAPHYCRPLTTFTLHDTDTTNYEWERTDILRVTRQETWGRPPSRDSKPRHPEHQVPQLQPQNRHVLHNSFLCVIYVIFDHDLFLGMFTKFIYL